MYKLLFIDEEKEQFEYFLDYVDGSDAKLKFEIITQLPLKTLNEMIGQIIKINPDAIIVDYWLNEKKSDLESNYNVPYNGVELVEEFQSIRQKFPCFVLTAKDGDAVSTSKDVNIVYTKSLMHNESSETNAKATFTDRVFNQIEHYKSRIENAKSQLSELLEIRIAGKADIDIENKIIELDDFLEKSIDAKNSIPSEFKSLSNSNRLDNILNRVDELLKKIDNNAK